VEQFSRMHGVTGLGRMDDYHRRLAVEGTVFRAAAEYLGKEPWEVGPDLRH
jgi:hypothetical protein